jgi:hypothetical protein
LIGRVEGVWWDFGIDEQVGSILPSVKEKGGHDKFMSLLVICPFPSSQHLLY